MLIVFLKITYPVCVPLPTFNSKPCTNVLLSSSGLGPDASCTASDNYLQILSPYASAYYATINSSFLDVSLTLASAHTCQSNDYVTVTAYEGVGNHVIEKEIVSG